MKMQRLNRRVSGRDRMAIAAAVIAIVALVADLVIVQPLDREVAAKRASLARLLAHSPAASAPAATPRAQLAGFYARLPAETDAQEIVRKLHLGARQAGVRLERGQYRPLDAAGSGLRRYQIVLPASGTYAAIRRFIGSAMQEMPNLALEGIEVRRGDGGDSPVEAELRLVAFLRASA